MNASVSSSKTPESVEKAGMGSADASPTPTLGRLTRALLGDISIKDIPGLIPGVIVTAILAWISEVTSELIGTRLLGYARSPLSAVTVAIILGIVVGNSVRLPPWITKGLRFTIKRILKLGIILLGARLSILQVVRLGTFGIPIVVGCIGGALLLTVALGRAMRLPGKLATLIAVGTSICGVSAIIAAGPAIHARDEEIAYSVAVITIFGIFATIAYPYLANLLFLGDPVRAGLFLGTAIHDTSQVTGAALVYADLYARPDALSVAVVAKLIRNTFIAIVIPLMTVLHARKDSRLGPDRRVSGLRHFPLFVLGFLAVACIRTVGDIGVAQRGLAFRVIGSDGWVGAYTALKNGAVKLLVISLAAVGLTTRFRELRRLGVKPLLVGLAAACAAGLVSYGLIRLLGTLIAFS